MGHHGGTGEEFQATTEAGKDNDDHVRPRSPSYGMGGVTAIFVLVALAVAAAAVLPVWINRS